MKRNKPLIDATTWMNLKKKNQDESQKNLLEVRIVVTSVWSGTDRKGAQGAFWSYSSILYLDLGDHHMAVYICKKVFELYT